jgi:hypothetical protein
MSEPRVVRFYLRESLRRRVEAGNHNFINKFTSVLQSEGFDIRFHDNSLHERIQSTERSGYSVFLMKEPTNDRGLTIRQNYFSPFWSIEKTGKRWEWAVAKARFETASATPRRTNQFVRYWRGKFFKNTAENTSQDGFVYVPLQGKLLLHRSFQFCSPIEMLEYLLEYDTFRNFVVTLHPKENYSDEETQALFDLENKYPRLTVSNRDAVSLLQGCDYVATQNSAAAFSGYFFRKPAVLFGRINFHHIAANVHDLGPKEAISRVTELRPDFASYLWWFLQDMSINVGRPEAEDKIKSVLKSVGWTT